MALKRSEIPRPMPPAEAVDVPELGGEVIVRGLLLSERLALAVSDKGEVFTHVPRLLAMTVVDADQKPVFDAEEWEAFGAREFSAAMRLFRVAQRLCGMDKEAAEKN